MFGKKNRGPTSEELISKLEYKMDIVEMLMEKNEKDYADNFTELRDMINSQEKRSEENIQRMDEKLQSIKDMLEVIKSDLDVNCKKLSDVDTTVTLEIGQISSDLTKSFKKTEEVGEFVSNIERHIQEDISIVKKNIESKIDLIGIEFKMHLLSIFQRVKNVFIII